MEYRQRECFEDYRDKAGVYLGHKISRDGKYLASCSGSKVYLFEASIGKELRIFEGHTNSVVSLDFSPKSKYLASGSWDQIIRIWYPKDGKALKILEGHKHRVLSIHFSSDGR